MTFHNQTILIACSEKKDRLQFFNYFDELNADKIFTASDIDQMNLMLSNDEDDFSVLVFEISKQWVQNNSQIIRLKDKYPELKLIGLVSQQIGLSHEQYKEIALHVSELIFSPVSHQELIAKKVAGAVVTSAVVEGADSKAELEHFTQNLFQLSGLPKVLIDVTSHEVIHVNDALSKVFKVKESDLLGQVWYKAVDLRKDTDIEQLISQLTEKGELKESLAIDLGTGFRYIELRINYIYLGDTGYYLAELHDQTERLYQQQFLKHLALVTTLDFDNKQHIQAMQVLLQWAKFDFCFMVRKNHTGHYKQVVWDCSLNNYAQKFITANHEFIVRKIDPKKLFAVEKDAYKNIPGDDFLSYYSVNSFLVSDCFVDDENDTIMVAGSLKQPPNWAQLKLLFKQLSLHYKQSMAFKVLQHSHESESQYDVLTDLMNRRYIIKAIEHSIEQSPDFMAVMFLDLDRFKVINDSLGHDVGDDVLISVAKLLNKHTNGSGVAARYAGDEFLVLLNNNVDQAKTTQIAAAILKSVANPIKLSNGSEINLTISLGISYFPEHGQTVSKLIKHADIALYDAKLNGKNRYTVYNNNLDGDHTKQNEEMVKNLQHAIDQNQIDVYFQPKINANTEDIMGFEALVRWEHPELGLISPGLFIPLAEQSDLIHQIGLLVIEKSCVMLKKWQRKFNLPLSMSVNLSPVQLNDKDLTEKISDIIERTGIYSKHLDFEITESEKFKSVKDALLMFKKLVNLGCTLSIDDFGTGHSTLDYLRKIPAKTLKIDQVFVKNIGLSPDDEAILDATIDMAKRVGHQIVAEGVETEEQRIYLTQKGCDYFQGYLFCRPLPAKEIDRILLQREKILKNN